MSAQVLLDQTPLADGDVDDFPAAWRQDAEGLRAEIHYEEGDVSFANPRDMDQLGTMVCWHPDYALGDEQLTNGDGRGAVKNAHAHASRFRSLEQLARWASIAEQAPIVMPLYLYDHSGISISAGAPNPFDNPRVRTDEFGTGMGWDTSLVGVIYTTPARILELCGEPQLETDRFYCPRTWPEDGRSGCNWPAGRTAEEWLEQQLRNEVQEYDAYLRGEVFYYNVREIATGDVIDSCGGYLPDVSEEHGTQLDHVKQEARASLASAIDDKRAAAAEYAEAARCRYSECQEGNPTVGDDEQVTCRTCRAWMGLPELEVQS